METVMDIDIFNDELQEFMELIENIFTDDDAIDYFMEHINDIDQDQDQDQINAICPDDVYLIDADALIDADSD